MTPRPQLVSRGSWNLYYAKERSYTHIEVSESERELSLCEFHYKWRLITIQLSICLFYERITYSRKLPSNLGPEVDSTPSKPNLKIWGPIRVEQVPGRKPGLIICRFKLQDETIVLGLFSARKNKTQRKTPYWSYHPNGSWEVKIWPRWGNPGIWSV